MFSTIISAAICGIAATIVHVEVDMAQGLPGFLMVGYLGSEVKEAGERVRVALKNSGVSLPPMRITVNLSPADIRKGGTAFDLPIAVGILQSLGKIKECDTRQTLVVGELSLNGAINPVRGVLPLVRKAREEGMVRCLVPKENQGEGSVIMGIEVVGVSTLQETLEYLQGKAVIIPSRKKTSSISGKDGQEKKYGKKEGELDFAEIRGQASARRAAEIAAAGFHHMLLVGPPGSGKTMIARCIPGILPELTIEESLEVSTIYSISGLLSNGESIINKRPFISPHHTITAQALTGGGRIAKPGIISLAHKGVLFLDEMPEFKQHVLDMLRQPLEERCINIARLDGSYSFPADFMLVGALNPCPCGYFPNVNKCRCTPSNIRRYQSHISGPVLDRVDICAEVPQAAINDLAALEKNESSETIRNRVKAAREIQKERYAGKFYCFNSGIPAGEVKEYCELGNKERQLMEQAFQVLGLTARAYYRILRVARTIADLDGKENIKEIHLAEAISCRMAGGKYWEK